MGSITDTFNNNTVKVRVDADYGYYSHICDIHANANIDEKKLDELLYIIPQIPEMRVGIGGDSFENALAGSKSSPASEVRHGIEGVMWLRNKLLPIQKQLTHIGSGNHDFIRSNKINGLAPSEVLAALLNVPFFRSFGSVMFSCRKNLYIHFMQHSGKKPESIEWVQAQIFWNEHRHLLSSGGRPLTAEPNKLTKQWIVRPTFHIQGGSYLDWSNSYASDKFYRPYDTGSVITRMSGIKEKWEVNVFDDFNLFKEMVIK